MSRAERIRVRGRVQGVGFRPFVRRLATRFGVLGEVLNDAEGVLIHAEGARLDAFAAALSAEAPALARVEAVERTPVAPRPGLSGFSVVASVGGPPRAEIAPDARVCEACAAEIRDPANRRFRHAFASCTGCGPRHSIALGAPWDRAATTMVGFPMCPACRAEYEDPADRRFHAQPLACPACGPRLWLEEGGREVPGDPVREAAARIAAGGIVAVKGLGGFHLACDATDAGAVARLRLRKRRLAKPFALIAADLAMIRRFARVSEAEAALLASPEGPVTLLEAAGERLPEGVAPGQWTLGWMLPTTPLHLLLAEAVGRPLVMTSGNLSGAPMAVTNAEARTRLGGVADAILMHDRDIARRLDDGVARVEGGAVRWLRRGRGSAPGRRALPRGLAGAPPVLACGGQLKAALCLTREGSALLSQHLGDLDGVETAEAFAQAEADAARLFDHVPAALACDLHPDWRPTRRAEARAAAEGLPLIRVQHHHAHAAAAMAEAGWAPEDGPVLAVVFDGLGWGPDGTVWGGEFLLCTYARFERMARLAPAPLPGGRGGAAGALAQPARAARRGGTGGGGGAAAGRAAGGGAAGGGGGGGERAGVLLGGSAVRRGGGAGGAGARADELRGRGGDAAGDRGAPGAGRGPGDVRPDGGGARPRADLGGAAGGDGAGADRGAVPPRAGGGGGGAGAGPCPAARRAGHRADGGRVPERHLARPDAEPAAGRDAADPGRGSGQRRGAGLRAGGGRLGAAAGARLTPAASCGLVPRGGLAQTGARRGGRCTRRACARAS